MKKILLICTVLAALTARAQYSLTNIQLPKVTGVLGFTNADSAPTGMAKVAISLLNLSNVVASGSGGSGAGFYIMQTNGTGTNLSVWQPLTIIGPSLVTHVAWTNPPTAPTNLPPTWPTNGCTNIAGPYWPSGTNTFTNACGFVIIVSNGTNANWETNDGPLQAQLTNSGMSALYGVSVSHTDSGVTGTYYWTNGVFWKDGLPTNCTPTMLYFDNSMNRWVARKGATYYNNSVGASLLGTWNGGTYTSISNVSARGFPLGFWPGMALQVEGIGTNSGIFEFHHRVGEVLTFTNRWGFTAATSLGDDAYAKTNATLSCTLYPHTYWPSHATNAELYGEISTAAGSKYWHYQTNGAWELYWNVSGGLVRYIPRSNQITNGIVIVAPLPGGISVGTTPGTPPRLTYSSGTNCTYLVSYPVYADLINAVNQLYCTSSGTNCSQIWITTNGTAHISLVGALWKSIPQSDTTEWRPCP